jgi:hypothetical protein
MASASPIPSTTRPPAPGITPSTSRCSGTGPSIMTAGGPLPVARALIRRAPADRRATHELHVPARYSDRSGRGRAQDPEPPARGHRGRGHPRRRRGRHPAQPGHRRRRLVVLPRRRPDFAQGKGSPGRAQLYVDGRLAAQAEFPATTPVAFNPGGLTCGANPGTPVTPAYRAPFRFTGTLHTVTVDLSEDLITDTEGEMRMAMARQ